MTDAKRRCPGCMNLTDLSKKCQFCNFDEETYEQKRSSKIIPVGKILKNRYVIGQTLGIGGFGITYLGFDQIEKRTIAIKEFFPNGLVERSVAMDGNCEIKTSGALQKQHFEKGLESFAKEAQVLTELKCLEGIVQIQDFFRENNTAYLVMDYVQGISLKDYIGSKKGVLPQEQVLELMWPVLSSLMEIHRKGIIHRDISPDNIIYGANGQITLIDFGAARQAVIDHEKSMTIMLKQGYAPIEQYDSKGKQGEWTDIYAICATIYYLLSGIIPDASLSRLSADDLRKLKEVNPAVTNQVSYAISKGMELNVENRYQTIEELMNDLYMGLYKEEKSKTQQDTKGSSKQKTRYRLDQILILLEIILTVFLMCSVIVENMLTSLWAIVMIIGLAVVSSILLIRKVGIRSWVVMLPIAVTVYFGVLLMMNCGIIINYYWSCFIFFLYYFSLCMCLTGVISMIWYFTIKCGKEE